MTLDDLDPNIRAWLFAFEALRRLGFPSDQIYFEVNTQGQVMDARTRSLTQVGKPVISCVLVAQDRRFGWVIGAVDMDAAQIEAAYRSAVDLWNSQPERAEMDRQWFASGAFAKRFELVAALRQKGFLVPHVAT